MFSCAVWPEVGVGVGFLGTLKGLRVSGWFPALAFASLGIKRRILIGSKDKSCSFEGIFSVSSKTCEGKEIGVSFVFGFSGIGGSGID